MVICTLVSPSCSFMVTVTPTISDKMQSDYVVSGTQTAIRPARQCVDARLPAYLHKTPELDYPRPQLRDALQEC